MQLTAAGVAAGLDLSLWIVERECGAAVADAVAGEIEHRRGRDVHRALREDRPPAAHPTPGCAPSRAEGMFESKER